MRTTGKFETHSRRINGVKPNQPGFTLVFFGDVHKFSPLHCDETWREFLTKYRNRTDCYFICMGDWTDLIAAKERKILNPDNLHESTAETLEDFYQDRIDKLHEEISFMRSRLLVSLEGNHHVRFCDGSTSTQRLLRLLNRNLPDHMKAHYMGDVGFVELVVPRKGGSSTSQRLVIALHHGIGGGRTAGASYNPIERMAQGFEADCFCMGDNHQRGVHTANRLYLTHANNGEPDVRHRELVMIRTGSFLRGYVKGKASYIADKLFNPANLGWVEVVVTLRRDCKNDGDRVWLEMEPRVP